LFVAGGRDAAGRRYCRVHGPPHGTEARAARDLDHGGGCFTGAVAGTAMMRWGRSAV